MFECFRCTKPDRKEFSKIAIATAIGFGIMVILTYPISNLFYCIYILCFRASLGSSSSSSTSPSTT